MAAGGRTRIVVEGVGDVVDRFYANALGKLQADLKSTHDVEVTYCDLRANWVHDERLRAKREATVAKVKGYGALFLDKSDDGLREIYEGRLEADFVIVATSDNYHEQVASHWLRRGAFRQLFIEKPLARYVDQGALLLRTLASSGEDIQVTRRILSFDHYYARFRLTEPDMKEIYRRLGQIRKFTFYFLEDRSGADRDFISRNPGATRNGPIENEQRVEAVREGLILDMMPHVVALANRFGRTETLSVESVRAGRYVGVDDDLTKPTEIDKETFGEIRFSFLSEHTEDEPPRVISGIAYVGKGIRGVKGLRDDGRDMESPVKLLEVEGETGERLRVDFTAGRTYLVNADMEYRGRIARDPYYEFLRSLILGTPEEYAQTVQRGSRALEILAAMRSPVNAVVRKQPNGLPTYQLGINGGPAPWLDEVLDQVGDWVNREEPYSP